MSTKPTATVDYYYTGSSNFYTVPAGLVQGVQWSTGRRNITDQFSGGRCTVYGRSPSNLVQTPEIGKRCRVVATTNGSSSAFWGFIADYRIIYGTTAAYDTFEIVLETGYSLAARRTGTVTSSAATGTQTFAGAIATAVGDGVISAGDGYSTITSAQTFTGQYSDAIDACLLTDAGILLEGNNDIGSDFYPVSVLYGHNAAYAAAIAGTFTDVSSDPSSSIRYTEIEFLSAAYNVGSKVTVQATGLAEQTSGTGNYTQTFATINGTTADAANLAGYLKAKLDYSSLVPASITFNGAANAAAAIVETSANKVGYAYNIKFRGTTYAVVVEGVDFGANPTDWRCTFRLSSSLQNAFLRLDNTTYGTLDNNKLGF